MWHQVLEKLLSMELYFPRSRGMFRQIQEALIHVKRNMSTMTKGVHQDLIEFHWLTQDLGKW